MFPIMADEELLNHDFGSLVIVEASKKWPDQLVWQNADQQGFVDTYHDYVSRHGVLNELFMLEPLVAALEKDGLTPAFSANTETVQANHDRWIAPLQISGLDLRKYDGTLSDLWDYQRFSLNRAHERLDARARIDRLFTFGWGAGTGKSAACAAGALHALNAGKVDVVLAFTMRKLKLNLRDFFIRSTPLAVSVCDGPKAKRDKLWENRDTAVFINNFDKAHWDHDTIAARIAGQRVLFVFDEVEYLLTETVNKTRVRKAMDSLMKSCHSSAWPMSASIVDHSPLTYHDNYALGATTAASHPLGTRKDFEARYLLDKTSRTFSNPHGMGYFTVVERTWDHVALQEVRHRVSQLTQNARQTDPGVRENFPGISTIVVPIQLSEEDRRLYDTVREWARGAYARGEAVGEHVELMRYICNHPGALGITDHPLGAKLAAEHPKLITGRNSSKLEVFCDQVEAMAAAGEKVVGFTKWTNLCLLLVSESLAKRGVGFVEHHSEMSDTVAYEAVQKFKTDPSVTLFWSSDVGSHGLSFQMARYVINYECPYAWRMLNQRMNRINRADGALDGRVSYVYVTDDTIETKIKERNDERRAMAEATTGAREVDTWMPDHDDPDGRSDLEELLFSD